MKKLSTHKGEHLVWLSGMGLVISVVMILAILLLISIKGFKFFWPQNIEVIELQENSPGRISKDKKYIAGILADTKTKKNPRNLKYNINNITSSSALEILGTTIDLNKAQENIKVPIEEMELTVKDNTLTIKGKNSLKRFKELATYFNITKDDFIEKKSSDEETIFLIKNITEKSSIVIKGKKIFLNKEKTTKVAVDFIYASIPKVGSLWIENHPTKIIKFNKLLKFHNISKDDIEEIVQQENYYYIANRTTKETSTDSAQNYTFRYVDITDIKKTLPINKDLMQIEFFEHKAGILLPVKITTKDKVISYDSSNPAIFLDELEKALDKSLPARKEKEDIEKGLLRQLSTKKIDIWINIVAELNKLKKLSKENEEILKYLKNYRESIKDIHENLPAYYSLKYFNEQQNNNVLFDETKVKIANSYKKHQKKYNNYKLSLDDLWKQIIEINFKLKLDQENKASLKIKQESFNNIYNLKIKDELKSSIKTILNKIKEYEMLHDALQLEILFVTAQVDSFTSGSDIVVNFETINGRKVEVTANDIVHYSFPNQLGFFGKIGKCISNIYNFIFSAPRHVNTEGGIFPAILGTLVMTIVMSLLVTPLGVITAIYLHEYAKQGTLISAIRIAINNLAGVPSIVFGAFGLGFFIYFIGGNLDSLFYSDTVDATGNSVFGSGGVLWASLTLALLTLPVVIVSTEESLAAVPKGLREGSLACGASKWQMIRTIILPGATPGILTGMILAMARGAGEVAPLMLVGAIQSAEQLPINSIYPFIHLDQQFMHLGFHIYNLGFLATDSEAVRPILYATTLFLIVLVCLLNLVGIIIRQKLRKKLASKAF